MMKQPKIRLCYYGALEREKKYIMTKTPGLTQTTKLIWQKWLLGELTL